VHQELKASLVEAQLPMDSTKIRDVPKSRSIVMKTMSSKQRMLFDALSNSGELIFAIGSKGVSANMIGNLSILNVKGEDQICLGGEDYHVHVDWGLVRTASISDFHGEGMITFSDHDRILFKIYRPSGPFAQEVEDLLGELL